MMKIIINADDFGVNECVTLKTERLIEAGLISSTTIMANGDCLDEVERFASLHREISYGIHLCLDEYESLTKNPVLSEYGITDASGNFIKGGVFACPCFDDRIKKAIFEELCAQVEKILSLGIHISHADSHHLVHSRIAALQNTFMSVLEKYGIKKVRLGEVYSLWDMIRSHRDNNKSQAVHKDNYSKKEEKRNNSKIFRLIRLVKTIITQFVINQKYKKHFTTTDFFDYYYLFIKKGYIKSQLKKTSSIELMCHPGHPSLDYQEEIHLIEANALKDLFDYKLITYNEL